MRLEVNPTFYVRHNQAESSWEVVVDLGRFGRLYSSRQEAEGVAQNLREADPTALESALISLRRLWV